MATKVGEDGQRNKVAMKKSLCRQALLSALAASVLPLIACGESDVELDKTSAIGRGSNPLINALPDNTHGFAVGVCEYVNGACSVNSGNCTGSLIAPNLVLTARHCVDRGMQFAQSFCDATFLGNVTPSELRVTTHPDPYGTSGALWRTVKKVLLPADAHLCASDIALIILNDNVPRSEALPIEVDVDTNLAVVKPSVGAIVARGAVGADLVSSDGTYHVEVTDNGKYRRRMVENIPVVCVSDTPGACSIEDVTDPSGTFVMHVNAILLGPAILPGDSGAGLVDQASLTTGAPRLIGVNHLSTFSLAKKPNSSGALRVSKHADFLRSGALEAAKLGGYTVPSWVTPGVVPDAGQGPDAGSRVDAGEQADAGILPNPVPGRPDGGTGASDGSDAGVAPMPGQGGGCSSTGGSTGTFVLVWLILLQALLKRPRTVQKVSASKTP